MEEEVRWPVSPTAGNVVLLPAVAASSGAGGGGSCPSFPLAASGKAMWVSGISPERRAEWGRDPRVPELEAEGDARNRRPSGALRARWGGAAAARWKERGRGEVAYDGKQNGAFFSPTF
ncbi:hypothetical protein ZWY2020_002603 [Hordeum vulgare]|nr:hypothetical protein ZWY2020_002603 [Hordeum vulgare]